MYFPDINLDLCMSHVSRYHPQLVDDEYVCPPSSICRDGIELQGYCGDGRERLSKSEYTAEMRCRCSLSAKWNRYTTTSSPVSS